MRGLAAGFGFVLVASGFATADSHLGPVTDILIVEEKIFSCSQAGIFVGTGEHLNPLIRPQARVTGLALMKLPGSELLVFSGGDPGRTGLIGWIRSEPPPNGVEVYMPVSKDLVYDLDVSPDHKLIAVACADGSIRLTDLQRLERGDWTVLHKHTSTARVVAFSPDGKWLASSGLDGVVILSEVAGAGQEPRALVDHTSGVECLVFSPDSQQIASGSKDSKVRLHDVSGKLIRTYHGLGMGAEPVAGRVPARVLALAWNDQQLVAGTSKGTLHRLSQTDDTTVRLSPILPDPIYALAFNSQGTLLAGSQSRLHLVPAEVNGP